MKLTKLCLFLVALIAAVCLMGCGDSLDPVDPSNNPSGSIDGINSDLIGTIKEVAFFNFETTSWKTRAFAPIGDGATIEDVEGAGIDGSNCIRVIQGADYGQAYIKAQDAYSKGKSYYFEAWFKDDNTPETVNGGSTMANLSITVYDQDIVNITAEYGTEYWAYDSSFAGYNPDQPSPYDASAGVDISGYEEALADYLAKDEEGELLPLTLSEEISNDDFTLLNAIVRSEDLDKVVSALTPEDLVGFFLNFYCGAYPNQTDYRYFLDNIRILDLNPEIPDGNGKHIDPPTIAYGVDKDNIIIINIFDGDNEDIYLEHRGALATYTFTGTLPEGLELKGNGDFEGNISEDLVEFGGEDKTFVITVTATNKAGTEEKEVTIIVRNAEPVEEEITEEGSGE